MKGGCESLKWKEQPLPCEFTDQWSDSLWSPEMIQCEVHSTIDAAFSPLQLSSRLQEIWMIEEQLNTMRRETNPECTTFYMTTKFFQQSKTRWGREEGTTKCQMPTNYTVWTPLGPDSNKPIVKTLWATWRNVSMDWVLEDTNVNELLINY